MIVTILYEADTIKDPRRNYSQYLHFIMHLSDVTRKNPTQKDISINKTSHTQTLKQIYILILAS